MEYKFKYYRRILKILFITLSLSLFSCEDDNEEVLEIFSSYSSNSVCDCHNSAVSILGQIIDIRVASSSYNDYIANESSVNQVELLINEFDNLRMDCLFKFGTLLFIESECNKPCLLEMIMDDLWFLGITV